MKRLVFAAFTIFAFQSCDKKDASPIPVITSINPDTGVAGTTVTITGKYFSNVVSRDIVQFNGLSASVTIATDTSVKMIVPKGATTGKITLTVNGQTVSSEFDFSVPIPEYLPNVAVTTLAGSTRGYADGPLASALFDSPGHLAVDAAGNIYLTEFSNSKIRKISADGNVTVVAGSTPGYADGLGIAAQFNNPSGLALDPAGNLYVADYGNYRIRKITPDGNVTTVAGGSYGSDDGQGGDAQFAYPSDVALDADGNAYITDNRLIRKMTSDGNVTTPFSKSFNGLNFIAIDNAGNIYAGGSEDGVVKITPDGNAALFAVTGNGYVDGPGATARMYPIGLRMDSGGKLYLADGINNAIRRIGTDGYVSTVAGAGDGFKDGIGSDAQFTVPLGVAVDSNGVIYVADTFNHRIRKIVIQ